MFMIIDFNEPSYSYEKFVIDAKNLVKKYTNILQYVTIGASHDHRDIVLLKLGLGEKNMICCGGVHARETINPIVLMKIIEYYAELYVNYQEQKKNLKRQLYDTTRNLGAEYEQMLYGACIYELLQTFSILFVPLLNPDGYMISLEGFNSIRDPKLREKCIATNVPPKEWKFNARAIDINRNFPSRLWSKKFEKDYPASENETKALILLFHEYKSKGFLDFHSRGKSVYYYRHNMPDAYNLRQLEIAKRFIKTTNYVLVEPELEIDPGDTGGNTVHYYSERFRKPALTIETVEEEASFPLKESYRYSTFEEIKLVIFEFGSIIAT
jgi:g-D-glutamyl-meso-diaminopimelate peptidase